MRVKIRAVPARSLHGRPIFHTDWMMQRRGAATSIVLDERGRRRHPVGRRPAQRAVSRAAPAQGRRLAASAIVLVVVVLDLLGVDVVGWLSDLWDQIKDVPPGYIVAALIFQSGQTVFAGLSYYGILRAAYPGEVEFWPIVTAYAVGVAMNNFLPANIGTFATLVMFVRDHPVLHVRRGDRRLPRPEDLLHGRRHVRLPLPVPVRCRARSTRASATSRRIHCARSSIAAGVVILIVILARSSGSS